MNDAALEGLHALPVRRVAFGMPVIALTHPEEIRGEGLGLAGVGPDRFDGPQIGRARPARRGNLVPIADVLVEPVLGDDLAHIGANFRSGCDRCAGPGLETIAEGMKIAVGADTGIAVGQSSAAKALLRLQHDKTRARRLRGQMIGAADAGNTGSHDRTSKCSTDREAEELRVVARASMSPALFLIGNLLL